MLFTLNLYILYANYISIKLKKNKGLTGNQSLTVLGWAHPLQFLAKTGWYITLGGTSD